MLFATNKLIDEMNDSEINAAISDKPISQKKAIVDYMRSIAKAACTTARVNDRVTKQEIMGLNDDEYSDGTYTWYEADIYHLEKYNLKLSDDFIRHVLEQSK